ncbi:TPA: phage tail terminator protein [Providencia alcalifaciens]
MIKHTAIRHALVTRLQAIVPEANVFDGIPRFLQPEDLPALAVWISDAEYQGETLDSEDWTAVLHIGVFLGLHSRDSELDQWIEAKIYPALHEDCGLSALISGMTPLGYHYQHDDDLGAWAAAEITYQMTYDM